MEKKAFIGYFTVLKKKVGLLWGLC